MNNLLEMLWKNSVSKTNLLAYRFLETGDVIGPRVELTWSELANKVKSVAATLQTCTQPGNTAILLYEPGLDFITAMYGCFAAGVIAVPSYPPDMKRLNRTLPRLQAIAMDASARVVLTSSDLLEVAEPLCAQVDGLSELHWVATDKINSTSKDWKEHNPQPQDLAYLQYTSGSTGNPKGVMVSHSNLFHSCLDMVERWPYDTENAHQVSWLPTFHDLGLIWGLMTPMMAGISCTLMAPGSFLEKPARWLEAITYFRATMSAAPNFAYDLCVRKIDERSFSKLDLSCLQASMTGAEPVRTTTIENFCCRFEAVGFRREILCPWYGLAEATLQVTITSPGINIPIAANLSVQDLEQNQAILIDNKLIDAVSVVGCGKISNQIRLAIVDPETKVRTLEGQIGEIWVCGPIVAVGYWQQAELSEEVFQAKIVGEENEQWLRTGDLGFMLADELFVTGRHKDLIIIRGRNIYPQDVEKSVEQVHPAIRPGCVAAFPLEIAQEETIAVVAEIEPKNLGDCKTNELIASIRLALVKEFQVEIYAIVLIQRGAIYKTSSGKIQRKACRKAFLEDSLNPVASSIIKASYYAESLSFSQRQTLENILPENNIDLPSDPHLTSFTTSTQEIKVQGIDRDFLSQWIKTWINKHTRVSIKDIQLDREFSYYNIDSLTGVMMAQELEALLGFSVPQTIIWDYPSLSKTIDYIYETTNHSVVTKKLQPSSQESKKSHIEIDSLFDQIESLSDEEVNKFSDIKNN